jgi:hypothetical protein
VVLSYQRNNIHKLEEETISSQRQKHGRENNAKVYFFSQKGKNIYETGYLYTYIVCTHTRDIPGECFLRLSPFSLLTHSHVNLHRYLLPLS